MKDLLDERRAGERVEERKKRRVLKEKKSWQEKSWIGRVGESVTAESKIVKEFEREKALKRRKNC